MKQLFVALAIALCVHGMPARGAEGVVMTDSGGLRGVIGAGVVKYLGIPYAEAPVRWTPPEPPQSWRGHLRRADHYGPACPQPVVSTALSPVGRMSEDCLYLNVWAPAKAPSAGGLPVMVWFHGGGFFTGSGDEAELDTDAYAKRGIVLVTLNYRLGRLGFFAHPAIASDSGNYGLMDAIAALRWIRLNIGAFGGDPHNVTIFGESAGGAIVNAIMVSPMTKDLFQKGIIESGALLEPLRSLEAARAMGVSFAQSVGITGDGAAAARALRALPLDVLIPRKLTAAAAPGFIASISPMIDGKLLIESPIGAFLTGRQARVPVIIGSNSMEGAVWSWEGRSNPRPVSITGTSPKEVLAQLGGDRDEILKAYRAEYGNDFGRLIAAVESDLFMGAPTRYEADLLARAGAPVYDYRFSAVPAPVRAVTSGAPHGTEIFYVFGTLGKMRLSGSIDEQDRRLSQAMIDYWTSFAKTGRPGAPNLPAWPTHRPGAQQVMEFTREGPLFRDDPGGAATAIFAQRIAEQAAAVRAAN